MTVQFTTYNQVTPVAMMGKKANTQQVVTPEQRNDEVTLSEKPKKKGFFTRLKNGYANLCKFGASTIELTKGIFKGVTYGAATAGGAIIADLMLSNNLKNLFNKPLSHTSATGKCIAVAGAALVFLVQTVKGKLNANERSAKVDHRWKTGHNS